MKGATQCARRVKLVFRNLRTKLGKVNRPVVGDPLTQLVLGVLSRNVPESKAREALDALRATVVDYNELRVIPPLELAGHLPDYPDGRTKCEDISRALNRIFAIEHTVSLDRFSGGSSRDVSAYLEKLDGLDAYSRARVRLLGFQLHAVPLDEAMWAMAKAEGMVADKASLEEAQSFLERQVGAEDALEFFSLLRKQAWADFATAVRRGEATRILSVPPDRTSRNMLQQVSAAAAAAAAREEEAAENPPEPELDDEEIAPATTAAKPAKPGRASARSAEKASGAKRRPASRPAGAKAARTPAKRTKARSA
ncbi:MAG: hypothetical protein U1D55_09005 [Phycisphaerae bacterium]